MAQGVSPFVNKLLNVIFSVGAAIVIIGALFKIQHYPYANIILPIGLLTEAGIFMIYAFLPPPADGVDTSAQSSFSHGKYMNNLDEIFTQAGISDAVLQSLGDNFKKLNNSVSQIADISQVVKSTQNLTSKTDEAATALGNVAKSIHQTTQSLTRFNEASSETKAFHEQVQLMTKNLGALNTVYELELQESNNHLKVMNGFYGKLAKTSEAMSNTLEDAAKTREEIALLASNLGKLNQVYGNMLTAMQGR